MLKVHEVVGVVDEGRVHYPALRHAKNTKIQMMAVILCQKYQLQGSCSKNIEGVITDKSNSYFKKSNTIMSSKS